MTRNDDGYWITTIGGSNGTHGFRATNTFRDFTVRRRLAVRNALQFLQNLYLEIRARKMQRQVKDRALTGEVFFELLAGNRKRFLVEYPVRLGVVPHLALWETNQAESVVVPGQQQVSNRRVQVAVVHLLSSGTRQRAP